MFTKTLQHTNYTQDTKRNYNVKKTYIFACGNENDEKWRCALETYER